VTGCGTHWFFNAYLPANLRFIARRDARQADFYSTYRRYDCHELHRGFPLLLELERKGVTLAVVRDMQGEPRTRSSKRSNREARDATPE
jgi:hypothetical protein